MSDMSEEKNNLGLSKSIDRKLTLTADNKLGISACLVWDSVAPVIRCLFHVGTDDIARGNLDYIKTDYSALGVEIKGMGAQVFYSILLVRGWGPLQTNRSCLMFAGPAPHRATQLCICCRESIAGYKQSRRFLSLRTPDFRRTDFGLFKDLLCNPMK